MSGVWVFRSNGVMCLVDNAAEFSSEANHGGGGGGRNKKVLVHLPSGQPVSSYGFLQKILEGLGWERYYEGDPDFFQFHKRSSIDLISLPMDFSKFNSIYMYDLVIKNPNVFHVRES
ncbi:flowering-promoting factor 1-like protein 1 [Momordica charantia]|uniref:Flowering-promoting factor 1-like protein 1 n=1 Tax=Momordica charantia TaxID=3673 RepID=A0A6J1CCN4_MOMCH|nr:flowering-promoting factor 1-like protein 1 [Momordica charantia]